jgi:hypothetical protein
MVSPPSNLERAVQCRAYTRITDCKAEAGPLQQVRGHIQLSIF